MNTSNILMCLGFASMIFLWVAQQYLTYNLLKTLMNRFPAQWESMGKPTMIMNNSLNGFIALYSFLWRKRYLNLEDPDFSKQCIFFRSFSIFSLVAAVLWIIAGSIFILTQQIRT